MLEAYRQHVAERAALGIPPLPLSKQQTQALVELLQTPPAGEEAFLVDLLTHRVPAGVDDAAKVKAEFLAKVAKGEVACGLVSKVKATELLGTMLGGYNVKPLIDLLAICGAPGHKMRGHEARNRLVGSSDVAAGADVSVGSDGRGVDRKLQQWGGHDREQADARHGPLLPRR